MYVITMNVMLLLCLVTCVYAAPSGQQTYSLENAEVLFEKFIVDYDKQYADAHEKQMRFEIFKQNLIKVNALNEKQGGTKVYGITTFSDYTAEENEKMRGLLGSPPELCKIVKTDADIPDGSAPDTWDWREKNVVTEIKKQLCGSCYAYSSTGNIEGQYAIKNKQLLSLSEQQIVDCSYGNHSQGCKGGTMSGAFLYLLEQGGIEKESDYPTTAKTAKCAFDSSKVAIKLSNCTTYNLKSQNKLKELLYQVGPISVGIDADDIESYRDGVIKDCKGKKINHAVLLVGYGTDPVGGDYWLLKNSWGKNWGDEGYFRIERGDGLSSCGMMNDYMASANLA